MARETLWELQPPTFQVPSREGKPPIVFRRIAEGCYSTPVDPDALRRGEDPFLNQQAPPEPEKAPRG